MERVLRASQSTENSASVSKNASRTSRKRNATHLGIYNGPPRKLSSIGPTFSKTKRVRILGISSNPITTTVYPQQDISTAADATNNITNDDNVCKTGAKRHVSEDEPTVSFTIRLSRPPAKLAKKTFEDQVEDVRKIFESSVTMQDQPTDNDKENENHGENNQSKPKRTWHICTYIEQNVYPTEME